MREIWSPSAAVSFFALSTTLMKASPFYEVLCQPFIHQLETAPHSGHTTWIWPVRSLLEFLVFLNKAPLFGSYAINSSPYFGAGPLRPPCTQRSKRIEETFNSRGSARNAGESYCRSNSLMSASSLSGSSGAGGVVDSGLGGGRSSGASA